MRTIRNMMVEYTQKITLIMILIIIVVSTMLQVINEHKQQYEAGNLAFNQIRHILEENQEELEKFGIEVIDNGNEVIINNSKLHKPNEVLKGRNDHRIVMALSMMLTKFGGSISGCNAVTKSYPNFFEDLKSINIEVIRHDEE